jgi:hypothetical protein
MCDSGEVISAMSLKDFEHGEMIWSVYRILCKQPSSPAFSQREKELRQEESIYSEALALWERAQVRGVYTKQFTFSGFEDDDTDFTDIGERSQCLG